MPNSSGPLAFKPSPENPIHVVGDLSIDHLVTSRPHYKRGTPPRDNNPCPTAHNVQAQSNWRTYGGYPFMAHILRSWYGDEQRNNSKSSSLSAKKESHKVFPTLRDRWDGDMLSDNNKNLQHLYWHLKPYRQTRSSKQKVFRLDPIAFVDKQGTSDRRNRAIRKIVVGDPPRFSSDLKTSPLCTVIVDRNFGFRDLIKVKQGRMKGRLYPWVPVEPDDTLSAPRYICAVDNALPKLESGLWERLSTHASKQTMVVVTAKMIRAAGHKLSHRISWEQTVEDYIKLHSDAENVQKRGSHELFFLSKFRWVVVTFGVTGCVLTDNLAPDARKQHTFIYDPNPPIPFYRDMSDDGRMRGNKTMFVTGVIDALTSKSASKKRSERVVACDPRGADKGTPITDVIAEGLKNGMRMCQQLHRTGMGTSDAQGEDLHHYYVMDRLSQAKTQKKTNPAWWDRSGPGAWVDRNNESHSVFSPDQSNYIASIPYEKEEGSGPWEILGYAQFGGHAARASWIGTAHRIVLDGIDNAMNRSLEVPGTDTEGTQYRVVRTPGFGGEPTTQKKLEPLRGPVERFGNLSAILREDIENFNRIRNLLRHYHRRWRGKQESQPLSIAVFGPPGTGKSFAVGQIAKSINRHEIEPLTFNVAQFDNTEQLVSALIQVRDINLEGKLPLVFFDEFDSKAPGSDKPLGWLKYFLAPMEDGEFLMPNQGVLRVGQAIFVFAGGTSETYQAFAGFDGSKPELIGGQTYAEVLRDQKGTDFLSRLRGHMNIPAIDFVDAKQIHEVVNAWDASLPNGGGIRDTEKDDIRPYLQRAIILRSMLDVEGLILRGYDRAKIDERVVAALLRVRRYRYGSRSMKQILKMCRPMNGGWIMPDSIPSRDHLTMHIDDQGGEVDEFLNQVRSPTYRIQIVENDSGKSNPGSKTPRRKSAKAKRKTKKLTSKASASTKKISGKRNKRKAKST